MTSNWPKIAFSDTENWLFAGNLISSAMNIKNKYSKVKIAKNYVEHCV